MPDTPGSVQYVTDIVCVCIDILGIHMTAGFVPAGDTDSVGKLALGDVTTGFIQQHAKIIVPFALRMLKFIVLPVRIGLLYIAYPDDMYLPVPKRDGGVTSPYREGHFLVGCHSFFPLLVLKRLYPMCIYPNL